jgi:hypothetical protein
MISFPKLEINKLESLKNIYIKDLRIGRRFKAEKG